MQLAKTEIVDPWNRVQVDMSLFVSMQCNAEFVTCIHVRKISGFIVKQGITSYDIYVYKCIHPYIHIYL